MKISEFNGALHSNDFMKKARLDGAVVYVQTFEDTYSSQGAIRGAWAFGLVVDENGETRKYKMVSSSSAQLMEIKTLAGVYARIDKLGMSPIVIPTKTKETVVFSSKDRG